jgi:hypothetical protein
VLAVAAMAGALEPKAAERQRLILQSARKLLRLNTPGPGRDNGLPTQAAVESYEVGRTCRNDLAAGAQPLDQEVSDPRLPSSNRNVRMAQTVVLDIPTSEHTAAQGWCSEPGEQRRPDHSEDR